MGNPVRKFVAAAVLTFSAFAVAALPLEAAVRVAHAAGLEDQKQEAERRRNEAAQKLAEATSQMEGVDAQLSALYIKQQEVESKIPVAVAELDAAKAELAAAQREADVVTQRLQDATDELQSLREDISSGEDGVSASQRSLAELVRQTYRGDRAANPLELVFAGKNTADFSKLSTAAETVARLESRALLDVQNKLAQDRSRADRQEALQAAIADLKAQADQSVADADQAKQRTQAKVRELEDLKKQNVALQQDLNSKRDAFEQDAQKAQSAWNQTNDLIKRLDAQLAKQQEEERRKAAASNRPYEGDRGSTSGIGADGKHVWGKPISGPMRVTSPFGYRIHPITGKARLHAGVDLASPIGQPQYASRAGTVVEASSDATCGNYVMISHGIFGGHRWMTLHCHLSSRSVYTGQRVSQGQTIGYTGMTGGVTGPHVHFQIMRDGVPINPYPYINY